MRCGGAGLWGQAPLSTDLRALAALHLMQLTLAPGTHQALVRPKAVCARPWVCASLCVMMMWTLWVQARTVWMDLGRQEQQHAEEDGRYRLASLSLKGAQAFAANDVPKTKSAATLA